MLLNFQSSCLYPSLHRKNDALFLYLLLIYGSVFLLGRSKIHNYMPLL
ncbi:MAG: hypothetical protein HRU26_00890 [Psychroserpens sp.]|nr:hypothetical protein [Psychroserpens sp.]